MWQLTIKIGRHKGASWPISIWPIVIGRAETCDVIVRDPLVSREHCRVSETRAGVVVLQDLASTNTTLVNGEPVSTCELGIGDQLSVGSATFMVTKLGSPHATPLAALGRATTQRVVDAPAFREFVRARTDDASPSDVGQLHALYRFSVNLSAIQTEPDLAAEAAAFIEAQVTGATGIVVTRSESGGFDRVFSGAGAMHVQRVSALREMLNSPIADIEPILRGSSMRLHGQMTNIAPLCVRHETIGVLAALLPDEAPHDPEHVMRLLQCAARAAAPYLWVARNLTVPSPERTATPAEAEVRDVLVGCSESMTKVRATIGLVARAELPVLIQGETGTGKELVARMIHRLSARADAPFIAVNCAAIPDELFESEFFGHSKGAFTGATRDKAGLFREADGGILFLDEVADLSPAGQSRLLRVIELGTVRPVGGGSERQVDVWVLSATNRDLLEAVGAGRFRDDLYYRLAGIELHIPPLRDRAEDIPELVAHFTRGYASAASPVRSVFDRDATAYLAGLEWPGNVRELRNTVNRAMALSAGGPVPLEMLRGLVRQPRPLGASSTLEEVERAEMDRVLKLCEGHISDAARMLGMHRNTLARKIRQYGL